MDRVQLQMTMLEGVKLTRLLINIRLLLIYQFFSTFFSS